MKNDKIATELKEKKEDVVFYSYDKILSKNCKYNVIFGERSNGKSYGALKIALEDYEKSGHQTALVRRFFEDFRGKRGQSMCEGLVANGEVEKITNGKWTGVKYYSSRWYLTRMSIEDKLIMDEKPFMYGFSLNDMEHDKSSSYPMIKNVIFDEFITRGYYLTDEFVLFMNVLSTIIRQRDNVRIFMLGNTVNKYCPYFKEMGLKHISQMKPGDLDIYTYANANLTVAVEYATMGNKSKEKKSNSYFAFDNPKLQMITGGAWELEIYPHLPCKYIPSEIQFIYFIKFDEHILQCEIINVENSVFTYIHEKTTPIKDEDNDVIFSPEHDPRPNWFRNIRRPRGKIDKRISAFFSSEKVFYQDNEIGEIVRNYLLWCASSSIVN